MRLRAIVFTNILLVMGSVAALAHHSFDAEYDRSKPVTLKGNVAKMEWMNPHIWIYMDVKGDDGKVATWQIEGGAPNSLKRQGWNRTSIKDGDMITVEGWLAKDGSKTANARSVLDASGKRLLAGSSEGTGK